MKKKHKPQRMTLDRLAASMQRELLGVGKKFDALDGKIDWMRVEIIDEVHKENVKVIESNDRVATKLDRLLKDAGAHDAAHKRLEDSVHNHEVRIKKLEQVRR
jgi:hypothetical protein